MSEAFSMIWMPWQPPRRSKLRLTVRSLYWASIMQDSRDYDTRRKQEAWIKWRYRKPDHDWPVCVY